MDKRALYEMRTTNSLLINSYLVGGSKRSIKVRECENRVSAFGWILVILFRNTFFAKLLSLMYVKLVHRVTESKQFSFISSYISNGKF